MLADGLSVSRWVRFGGAHGELGSWLLCWEESHNTLSGWPQAKMYRLDVRLRLAEGPLNCSGSWPIQLWAKYCWRHCLSWAVEHPVHSGKMAKQSNNVTSLWCVFKRCYSFLYWVVNAGCAKPSQSSNWGVETWAKRKLMFPCLLAIPVLDHIAGLYNRHLNSNSRICLH